MTMAQAVTGVPFWVQGRKRRGKRICRNIYLYQNAKGYLVSYYGLNPLTGKRVQCSEHFPPETPREEIDRYLARWERTRALMRKLGRQLRLEDRLAAKGAQSDPRPWSRAVWAATQGSAAARALMSANWVVVAKGSGIYRSDYGWMAVWRESHPITGERVARRHVFRTPVPPGESEAPPAYVVRYREQRKREGLAEKPSRPKGVALPIRRGKSQRTRDAKWVTVAWGSGIYKSDYGWQVVWGETDDSGRRRKRKHSWKADAPPGASESPPEYVTRYLEERKRLALEGKRSRRDLPKNVRLIRIAPPPAYTPSFAVQFTNALKAAGYSNATAARVFGVSEASIKRHRKGESPTPRVKAIYEEKLTKRLGRQVSFVL